MVRALPVSACALVLLLGAGCRVPRAPGLYLDGSEDFDASLPDAAELDGSTSFDGSFGWDGGLPSACGQPGDRGNQLGIGKFCQQLSDCPGDTICSASVNDPTHPETNTYFCTLPCDPCSDPASVCGAGSICACTAGLDCACVPTSCGLPWSQPDCLPDGGLPVTDGGAPMNDGGVPTTDGGEPMSDGGMPTPDAGQVDGGPRAVGGSCTSNADCVTGTCITQFPEGYCSVDCSNGGTCPTGTSCQFLPGIGQRCQETCSSSSTCRDGYQCAFLSNACFPAYCTSDWQCPQGQTCNPHTNVCTSGPRGCDNPGDCPVGQLCDSTYHCFGSAPPPCSSDSACPEGETCLSTGKCSGGTSSGPSPGHVGASCSRGSNCYQLARGNTCLSEDQMDFVGGYCSGNCSSDAACGSGNVCAQFRDTDGNTSSLCMQGCAHNTDCRPHYNCVQSGGKSFCLNACQANSDCIDPTVQACNPITGLCFQ